MCKPEGGVVRECSQEVVLLCVLRRVRALRSRTTLAVFFSKNSKHPQTPTEPPQLARMQLEERVLHFAVCSLVDGDVCSAVTLGASCFVWIRFPFTLRALAASAGCTSLRTLTADTQRLQLGLC